MKLDRDAMWEKCQHLHDSFSPGILIDREDFNSILDSVEQQIGEQCVPEPVTVGATRFGEGVKLSTILGRIERGIKYHAPSSVAKQSGPGVADVYEVYSAINGPARSAEPQERETPRTGAKPMTLIECAEVMSGDDNFAIVAQNARFREVRGARAVCSFCSKSVTRIADWLPSYHICESCFSAARNFSRHLANTQRELSQAREKIARISKNGLLLLEATNKASVERAEQQLAEYKKLLLDARGFLNSTNPTERNLIHKIDTLAAQRKD